MRNYRNLEREIFIDSIKIEGAFKDRIAVLIPCYNESKTVGKVVRSFKEALGENAVIYVYDNNSTD